jgi:hypothetical protein
MDKMIKNNVNMKIAVFYDIIIWVSWKYAFRMKNGWNKLKIGSNFNVRTSDYTPTVLVGPQIIMLYTLHVYYFFSNTDKVR